MAAMNKKIVPENRATAGFSVPEILVIVCLVMIMAAIVIPTTRSAVASYQLDAAVDSVTGAIQTTRYQAIMHGYLYQVDFNSATNQIQVSSEVPPAATFSTVGARRAAHNYISRPGPHWAGRLLRSEPNDLPRYSSRPTKLRVRFPSSARQDLAWP